MPRRADCPLVPKGKWTPEEMVRADLPVSLGARYA